MAPAALLIRSLQAQVTPLGTDSCVRAGALFVDRVHIANTGDVIWRARDRGFGGHVACGVKLCTVEGQLLRDDVRVPLPRDLAPGDEVLLAVCLRAPDDPGEYLLKYDMVVECVAWFEQHGSPPAERILQVQA